MKKRNAVKANKNLGQHFLTDQGMIESIVDAINPDSDENLLEIGPGLGAITLPVLSRCQSMTAIELDRRVIPILKEKAAPLGQLTIVEQDVLTIDYPALLTDKKWRVFGNLPYNISTPILFTLSAIANVSDMVFMLQKEVVDRVVALPGENNYGRLSVMLQFHHDVYPLFDVPPDSFSPPPKVMSAMVGLTRLSKPRWEVDDEVQFAEVVRQAFSMRRKTLRNTLKPLISGDELAELGVDFSLRAEVIDGSDFAKISNYLSRKEL
ncbi:MAG: 16S rRNA (adenine(1518)-N(6)/adenine(1519)-N(6))-dimethyltransferase RsmA [Gammaproteobacteria bacterium]|nr:16S rRNA (adenine(1518)-N(6)/adenine(1519)-N(6))-dimethyltransferase RsmA [Gammaproteobacteria bacterium]